MSTRRSFLATAALGRGVAAAAKQIRPSLSARPASRVVGANDRINIAFIGLGQNGLWYLKRFVDQSDKDKDIQVVAVSDIYTVRKEESRQAARLEQRDVHHDYRELLARKDVDAVFIATPDHWHAQMAIDSMAAGKDIYLQKPMTLTVDEGRQVIETAAKYSRIVQIGSQHVADPRHHKARELIQAGEIGDVVWAQDSEATSTRVGSWNYPIDQEGTPENIDWAGWIGPAPKRAFSAERYFRWRKYWDYSGGFATDKLYHNLAPMLLAVGPHFPTRVTGSGGIYHHKDREVPDQYNTIIEYPNFYICLHAGDNTAGPRRYAPTAIFGQKGTLLLERDRLTVVPDIPRRGTPPRPKAYELPLGDIWRKHSDDFFSAMRTRRKPVLNEEFGFMVMIALKLGNESYQEGKVKFFDPARKIVVEKGAPRPVYEGDGKSVAES